MNDQVQLSPALSSYVQWVDIWYMCCIMVAPLSPVLFRLFVKCKGHMIKNERFVVAKWPFSQMSVMCNGCHSIFQKNWKFGATFTGVCGGDTLAFWVFFSLFMSSTRHLQNTWHEQKPSLSLPGLSSCECIVLTNHPRQHMHTPPQPQPQPQPRRRPSRSINIESKCTRTLTQTPPHTPTPQSNRVKTGQTPRLPIMLHLWHIFLNRDWSGAMLFHIGTHVFRGSWKHPSKGRIHTFELFKGNGQRLLCLLLFWALNLITLVIGQGFFGGLCLCHFCDLCRSCRNWEVQMCTPPNLGSLITLLRTNPKPEPWEIRELGPVRSVK